MNCVGMEIEFNGQHYVLNPGKDKKKYAIGELVCEMIRFDTHELKDVLLGVDDFHGAPATDSLLSTAFNLREILLKKFLPVIGEMISITFINMAVEYYNHNDSWRQEWIQENGEICGRDSLLGDVFKDTGYDTYGAETLGQILLTFYLVISHDYMIFKHFFRIFLNGEKKNKKNDYTIYRLSSKDRYLQEIGYRILQYDGRFNSVFTIKSMISLCLFEMAHIINDDIPISICKNCGQYFVPLKRSDTKYCNYLAPGFLEKTCKEIGAQKAWASKEKTDDITHAYRKVYMRIKMRANRHPEDMEAQKQMRQLSEGIKEWRQKIAAGKAEKDDFMRWLEEF